MSIEDEITVLPEPPPPKPSSRPSSAKPSSDPDFVYESLIPHEGIHELSSSRRRLRCDAIYWAFLFLGVCTLVPWNFFITPDSYWQYKFRNVTDQGSGEFPAERTLLQESFESQLAATTLTPNIFFLLVAAALTNRLSIKTRIVVPAVVVALVLAATAAFVLVNTDRWQDEFFRVSIGSVVVVIGASALMQSGVFGLAASMSPIYMQAVLNGQSVCGTFASLVAVVTLAVAADDRVLLFTSFAYFLVGALCVFCAAFVVCGLLGRRAATLTETEGAASAAERIPLLTASQQDSVTLKKVYVRNDLARRQRRGSWTLRFRAVRHHADTLTRVLGLISSETLTLFLNFVATIAVFPCLASLILPVSATPWSSTEPSLGNGSTANVPATHPQESNYEKFFVPVFCFLLFNACDFVGRNVAGIRQWPNFQAPRWVLPLVMSTRLGFIPLFMFCNQVLSRPRVIPVVFRHDAFPIIFTVFFGFSNGYLSTVAFMQAPRRVMPEDADVAGTLLCLVVAVGLATGAGVGRLVLGWM